MENVAAHYDSAPDKEWARLDEHKTEFAVTCLALQEFLPPAARVIDIGGGPGRYALWLAERGCDVTLVDLSQKCLDLAAARAKEESVALREICRASALDLHVYSDRSFDAALMMGPLYHIQAEADRKRALEEAHRILRPGGMLFAVFLSRYGLLRYAAKYDPSLLWRDKAFIDDVLDRGYGRSQAAAGTFVDTAYFAALSEAKPFIEAGALK